MFLIGTVMLEDKHMVQEKLAKNRAKLLKEMALASENAEQLALLAGQTTAK